MARQYWDSVLNKCGDSYYAGQPGGLTEYKEVAFGIVPEMLSPADQMNGIQWKGDALMAPRVYRGQEDNGQGGWRLWKDGPKDGPTKEALARQDKGLRRLHMQKKTGQWFVIEKGAYAPLDEVVRSKTKPPCTSISGAAKR